MGESYNGRTSRSPIIPTTYANHVHYMVFLTDTSLELEFEYKYSKIVSILYSAENLFLNIL